MDPSRPNPVNLTGAFATQAFRSCGLTAVIREALRSEGVTKDAKIEQFLKVLNCSMILRKGGFEDEAIVTFIDRSSSNKSDLFIIRLSFKSLNSNQLAILLTAARGDRPKPIPSLSPRSLPEATLSHYERITSVLASCVGRMPSSEKYPSVSSHNNRSPRDYALLARALVAERYAESGQGKEALNMYVDLFKAITNRMRDVSVKSRGDQNESTLAVIGELFGYLLKGAAFGNNIQLMNLTVAAFLETQPKNRDIAAQHSMLQSIGESFAEIAASDHHTVIPLLLKRLSLPVLVRSLEGLFDSIDSRVGVERFRELEQYVYDAVSGEARFDDVAPESAEDVIDGTEESFSEDDLLAAVSRTIALSALRLGYKNVNDVQGEIGLVGQDATVAATLAGALIRDNRLAEARGHFDNSLARLEAEEREKQSLEFIHVLLKFTPQGYGLAADGLGDVSENNRIKYSFKIVCAAYRAGAIHWADGAFQKWLADLPDIDCVTSFVMRPGSFDWAINEGLITLRSQEDSFEHRGVIFAKLFDRFTVDFTDSPSDSALMKRMISFAGEHGLLDVLLPMDTCSSFSALREFEKCLATVRSRRLEGWEKLAEKAVNEANGILIDTAIRASHKAVPGFESLISSDDVPGGYVESKARLLKATLEANLSPWCEEIADSLVGSALIGAPNVVPMLLYQLGIQLRQWASRGYRPFSLD